MWIDLFHGRLTSDGSMRTVVATNRDMVVGHVQVDGNLLVHLFVDPDHQGVGIGSRLLAIGEALISEAGHTDAELHTRVDNVRAIALYRSVGWQVTDRVTHSAHDGIEYVEQVLVKHLERCANTPHLRGSLIAAVTQLSSRPAREPSARQSSSTLMNASDPAP